MSQDFRAIWHFDDGNGPFKQYPNLWVVIEKKFNGSKLVLQNTVHSNIIINTISEWKTKRFGKSKCQPE